MARKKFDVEEFKDSANSVLARSTVSEAMRNGWIAALEHVLHETGNYKGFGYLSAEEVPADQKPGIRFGVNGDMLPYDLRFLDCDDTRRAYS